MQKKADTGWGRRHLLLAEVPDRPEAESSWLKLTWHQTIADTSKHSKSKPGRSPTPPRSQNFRDLGLPLIHLRLTKAEICATVLMEVSKLIPGVQSV